MTKPMRCLCLASLLWLGASCSTPAAADAPPAKPIPALSMGTKSAEPSAVLEALPGPEEERPPAADEPLGWAAGRSLSYGQLISEWHATDPDSLWLVLEKLVTARLADAEAQRLELRVAPEAVEARFAEERGRLEALLQAEGRSLASHAREGYGQSPEVFLQALRGAVLRQMLIERVTRAWVLSSSWVRLRMIVVEGAELMGELRARLERGEDFASLAAEHSQDGSASRGGLVPFLVREEESPLSRRAFAQDVGELGQPFQHKGLEVLVRVEERHPERPLSGWASLGPEVEASLLEFPLSDTEFGHWKVSMEQRYPIDVEALLDLLDVESSG